MFSVSFSSAGTEALTVVYMGNADFLPVASAVTEATVVAAAVAGTDFTLASSGTATQSVPAGTVATFAFTVAEQGEGVPSQVALSAAGLPTGAVGSFSPMYIPPGTLSSAVTLTIQTPSAALRGPELLRRGWPPVALAGLWWVPWLVWGRRRRGLRIGRGAWCWLGALGMG